MDLKLVLKIFFTAIPIINNITEYIKNKSEEKVIEKSITLKILQNNKKEELINPLYIVED